jgi:hypothetical protein
MRDASDAKQLTFCGCVRETPFRGSVSATVHNVVTVLPVQLTNRCPSKAIAAVMYANQTDVYGQGVHHVRLGHGSAALENSIDRSQALDHRAAAQVLNQLVDVLDAETSAEQLLSNNE